jgi:hypothetical protein
MKYIGSVGSKLTGEMQGNGKQNVKITANEITLISATSQGSSCSEEIVDTSVFSCTEHVRP